MSTELNYIPVRLSNNHNIASPLRYPGGKSVLSAFVTAAIDYVGCSEGAYVEPYSGGAGVGLRLLLEGAVSSIVINDYDPAVYAFWNSAVNHTDRFLQLLDSSELTLSEWNHQREVFKNPESELELGFAFFYLNRTCRSGVVNGGVIGGKSQSGKYKLDARFNKAALRRKLQVIGSARESIEVSCLDGVSVIEQNASSKKTFLYVDPPYVEKGGYLYMNHFQRSDHVALASALLANRQANWLLTYDDTPLIRGLYKDAVAGNYNLGYSAHRRKTASELMIASDSVSSFVIEQSEE